MSDSDSIVPAGFRVIPGYPRYAINESGDVISVCGNGKGVRINHTWADAKRLNPTKTNRGYHFIKLRHDGRSRTIPVHALVLLTFVGPRPDGMECRHLDGCKENNHVSNLAWGTPLENSADRILHGTNCRGERVANSKLKADDVLKIRARSANGESARSIANDFPVVHGSIDLIISRRTWKHI